MNHLFTKLACGGRVLRSNIHNRRDLSFDLSDVHRQIKETCKKFSDDFLKPVASEIDRDASFPKEQIIKLGKIGLMSVCVDRDHYGSNLDTLALAVAVEELSKGCAGTGAIVSIHNCLFANLLSKYGTPFQKEKFLTPFTNGKVGCFALSEPNAGSDVANISCNARNENGYWIVNGKKSWVTSALQSDNGIIFATVDPERKHRGITAFIVPLQSEGVEIAKKEDLMGIRALSTSEVILENVRIPEENVVGEVGEGFKIAMNQLNQARIGISSQAIGIAQAALDYALAYSTKRIAFGKPISQLSAVQHRLAEMAVSIEGARLLTWKAALEYDSGKRSTKQSSLAKLASSDCANFVADNCVQILGGLGFVKNCDAERHFRDARVTKLYGGVTDVQKMVIAQGLLKEYLIK